MSANFSKPFALSMGPQACGTDILYDYFSTQPGVVLPSVREVFFFDRHIQRGADFYKGYFENRGDAQLFMELSTTAFDHPQAPERVQEFLGDDVKLFCPLRDPVARAWAVYDEYLRYGIVKGDIREACDQAPQILFASRYEEHLSQWLVLFDDIHFLSYEALCEKPEPTVEALCDFLGMPSDGRAVKKMRRKAWGARLKNSLKRSSDASLKNRDWLEDQLAGEVARVENLLGFSLFSN